MSRGHNLNSLFQFLFKIWGRSGLLPGYRYALVERFGTMFAPVKLFNAVLPNGMVVSCDLFDHVQRQIYYWGVYEPVESWIFTNLVKPGHIVIDAGANVGQYSMLASTLVKPDGAVHAFEPAQINRLKMAMNLVRNRVGNVSLNDLALWDLPEELLMSLDLADQKQRNFGAFAASKKSSTDEPLTVLSNSVAAIRLDEYVQEQGLTAIEPSLKPPLKLNSLDGIARMNVVAVPKEAPKPAVLESPIHLKPILAWARTVQRILLK